MLPFVHHQIVLLVLLTSVACLTACQAQPASNDELASAEVPAEEGSAEGVPEFSIATMPNTYENAGWFFAPTAIDLGVAEDKDGELQSSFALTELGGVGSDGPIEIVATKGFEIHGMLGPIGPNERREFSVKWVGTPTRPVVQGVVRIRIDGSERRIALRGVVPLRDLPRVNWLVSTHGTEAYFPLDTAPFPHKTSRHAHNGVFVFVPRDLDPSRDYGIVVHFHGYNSDVRTTVTDHQLREQLSRSHLQAILIAPQCARYRPDGYCGNLNTINGLRDLVDDVVSILYRDELVDYPMVEEVVLTAHSGGYEGLAMAIEKGGLRASSVHLFDAFYGFEPTFRNYILKGGRLVSVYTEGVTERYNRQLRSSLYNRGVSPARYLDETALANQRVIIARTWRGHNPCVYEDDAYGTWLRYAGLPIIEVE